LGFGHGHGFVFRRRLPLPPGQAEVENLDLAPGGEENVGRLDVAMDDVLAVSGGQTLGQRHSQFDGIAPGERRTAEAIAQRLAFQQLGDGVMHPFARADIEQDQNIRVR
jgi:hypothetical protein